MDPRYPLLFEPGAFWAPAIVLTALYGVRGVTLARVTRHATARHTCGRSFLVRDRWMGTLDPDHAARYAARPPECARSARA